MSDDEKPSMQLFNEARERGDTIGDSWRELHDEQQLDAFPPAPKPKWLVLSLDGHRIGIVKETATEYRASCSCGVEWTHSATETLSTMEAIFATHVKYFPKEKAE